MVSIEGIKVFHWESKFVTSPGMRRRTRKYALIYQVHLAYRRFGPASAFVDFPYPVVNLGVPLGARPLRVVRCACDLWFSPRCALRVVRRSVVTYRGCIFQGCSTVARCALRNDKWSLALRWGTPRAHPTSSNWELPVNENFQVLGSFEFYHLGL